AVVAPLVVVIALVVVALIVALAVAMTLIVRHADRHLPRADTTEGVGRVEEDVIHATVALAVALDQHGGLVRADAAGIGAAAAVDGLVLADRVDRDGDRIAVGIDHAVHRDRHGLVVRRPGRGRTGERPVTDGRPIEGDDAAEDHTGRILLVAACAAPAGGEGRRAVAPLDHDPIVTGDELRGDVEGDEPRARRGGEGRIG